jgi:hypothetical protein
MTGVRVFVSHSFGQDHTLLDAIDAELGADFRLYIDKDQNLPGWEWRKKVHVALAECDAAIILFNNRGMLQPYWVLKEATILLWRAAIDPSFAILPVRLPEVDPGAFNASPFEPLKLKDIILLKSADASDIAAAARARVHGMTRSLTPLDRIREAIKDALRDVGDGTLSLASQDILGSAAWRPGEDRKAGFAGLLAERMLAGKPESCLKTTLDVLTAVKPALKQQTGRQILKATGALWVEAEAAGGIRTASSVAINGRLLADFTVRQYLERAFPYGRDIRLAPVDSRPDEDASEYYVAKIRQWARTETGRPGEPDADIDFFLRQILGKDLFVLLPGLPDDTVLRALREWLPEATVVIGTGERLPDSTRRPANVRYLEPELDLALEKQAHWTYIRVDQFVRSLP